MRSVIGTAIVLFISTTMMSLAQLTEQKIQSMDGSINWFGSAVDIEGTRVIVGARLDDENAQNAGAAYYFSKMGSQWVQDQKVIGSDTGEEWRFGRSVGISADYSVIGAHMADGTIGAAYIFRHDGLFWNESMKLVPPDGAPGYYFGSAVAIAGDYAVVGAFGHDDSAGAAYVYHRVDTSWIHEQTLTASDREANDRFGRAVAIDGDYIVSGAYGDDDNGNAAGALYVYQRSGAAWNEVAKLLASDGDGQDHLGFSVGISGNYVVGGAHTAFPDSSGAAYVFKNEGGIWNEKAKLVPSDPGTGNEFGVSVSISGIQTIVGARFNDDQGLNSGSAYIYQRSGENWIESYKVVPSDGDSLYEFGRNVATTDDDAIVGAHLARTDSGRTGAAYIYADIPVSVDNGRPEIPASFGLYQNHPNPFNPSTTIAYSLAEGTTVELRVFNLLGQDVASLVSSYQNAGRHTAVWDGTNKDGMLVGGGIYIYRLTAGEFVQTRKMVLLK